MENKHVFGERKQEVERELAKAESYDEFYEKLDTQEGEKNLY